MDPRDMFCWNNGQTVRGGGGETFHADLFVVVTWRKALPYSADRQREGIFQSRNQNVHTSVAVHRNKDNRSAPKMAVGELHITARNCMFLIVATHAVAS
jgi:hypothetical protein